VHTSIPVELSQLKLNSTWQVDEQPSKLKLFPSSHTSTVGELSLIPSPQLGYQLFGSIAVFHL